MDIGNVAVGVGSGRLMLSGIVGSRLALKADARAIPLSAAETFKPGLGLAGTLDGSAELTGSPSAPAGPYRLHVAELVVPQTRSAGLGAIDVTASGRLDGTRATVDATVSAREAGKLTVRGSAPLALIWDLDVSIAGRLDAGLANRSLGAGARLLLHHLLKDAASNSLAFSFRPRWCNTSPWRQGQLVAGCQTSGRNPAASSFASTTAARADEVIEERRVQ